MIPKTRPLNEVVLKSKIGADAVKMAPIVEYDTGIRCLRTGDISHDRPFSDWGFCEVYEDDYSRFQLLENDILIARTGPIGHTYFVDQDQEAVFNNGILRIRVNEEECCQKFIYYCLHNRSFIDYVMSVSCGTAKRPNVKKKVILDYHIPWFSKKAQEEIASSLTAYDDLIENNNRRMETLEEIAQLIYRQWFVDYRFPGHEEVPLLETTLGMVPEGWEVKRLEECCRLVMGDSPNSEFFNEAGEGLPFHQGVTNFGKRFPRHVVFSTSSIRMAEKGDILLSVRAPVGRINIANDQIIIGRGLCAVRRLDGLQMFLFHQLKELFRVEDTMGGGTIFNSVMKRDLAGLLPLNPPRKVIRLFESRIRALFNLYEVLTKKNEELQAASDLLLPRLISGRLG